MDLKKPDFKPIQANLLRTVSCLSNSSLLELFYTPEIFLSVIDGVIDASEDVREDSLAAILNFSSKTEKMLKILMESDLISLPFAFHSFSTECLSLIADISANFLLASRSLALAFVRSVWMADLVEILNSVSFGVRQKISRCIFVLYQRYSDCEVMEAALEYGESCLNAVCDCLDGSEMDLFIGAVRGILGIFAYYVLWPKNQNVLNAIQSLIRREWSVLDEVLLGEDLPARVSLEVEELRCRLREFGEKQI
jgi:hypothetical protein